jgi:hypothetical protein
LNQWSLWTAMMKNESKEIICCFLILLTHDANATLVYRPVESNWGGRRRNFSNPILNVTSDFLSLFFQLFVHVEWVRHIKTLLRDHFKRQHFLLHFHVFHVNQWKFIFLLVDITRLTAKKCREKFHHQRVNI